VVELVQAVLALGLLDHVEWVWGRGKESPGTRGRMKEKERSGERGPPV
jgi:hypothetical protein